MDLTKPQPVLTDASAAQLRMRRTESSEIELTLPVEKATIGSGQSCTVRIEDGGVRPLHCLISSNADGSSIRRWSDNTLLNGKVFSEAPLRAGDRLTIGPVDFIFESLVPDNPITTIEVDARRVSQSTSVQQSEPVESRPKIDSSAQAVRIQRQRARRMLAVLRGTRQETSQLKELVGNLGEELKALRIERDSLQAQREDLANQLERLHDELTEARSELTALRQSQQSSEARLVGRLERLEQEIQERNESITSLRSEISQVQVLLASSAEVPSSKDREVTSEVNDHIARAGLVEEERDSQIEQLDADFEKTSAEAVDSESLAKAESAQPDYSMDIELPSAPLESAPEWSVPEQETPVQDVSPFTALSEPATPVDEVPEAPLSALDSANDPWGVAQAEQFTSVEEPEEAVESAATDSQSPSQLWDIEKNFAQESSGSGHSSEPESFETAEPLNESPQLPVQAEEPQPTVDPPKSEADLWGRLHDLRAAASDQLHHEVEEFDESTESHTTFEAEAEDQEEPSADELTAGFFGATAHQEEPIEAQRVEQAEPATVADELVESPEQAEQSALSQEETSWSEESVATPAATTLFDIPEQDEESREVKEEPVSFVEKYKHLLDEDDPQETISTPVVSTPQPEAVTADDDEESIEEYMAKMMDRLRSQSEPEEEKVSQEEASEPTEEVSKPAAPLPPRFPEGPIQGLEESVPAAEDPIECLSELKSSSRGEPSTDLNALRDLANSSAREAIRYANKTKAKEYASSKLLMSVVTALSGAFLITASDGEFNLAGISGALAIAMSGYWAARNLDSLGVKRRQKARVDAASSADCPIAGVEPHSGKAV